MRPIIDEIEKASEESEGGLLGLPETETELDVSANMIDIRKCMNWPFLYHIM